MRMHSVVLMALIMVFGQILGITGMFLSVPLVAAIKYYLVSANIPPLLLDPLVRFIEGDEAAPHRNFIDKYKAKKATYGADGTFFSQTFPVFDMMRSPVSRPSSEGLEQVPLNRDRAHSSQSNQAEATAQ